MADAVDVDDVAIVNVNEIAGVWIAISAVICAGVFATTCFFTASAPPDSNSQNSGWINIAPLSPR